MSFTNVELLKLILNLSGVFATLQPKIKNGLVIWFSYVISFHFLKQVGPVNT